MLLCMQADLIAVQGANRARFEEIRSEIIQCLALVEALIDFGEGEDIEEGVFQQGQSTPFFDPRSRAQP